MSKGQCMQEQFLGDLQANATPVSIFLVNGIKLQGKIASHDDSVIVLQNNITQMVYRHAISTVVPTKSLNQQASRPVNNSSEGNSNSSAQS